MDGLTPVERDAQAGRWVLIYYGVRFKVARLKRDRRRTQETSKERYDTLAEAQVECDRRNRRTKHAEVE